MHELSDHGVPKQFRGGRHIHFVCPPDRIWPELRQPRLSSMPEEVLAERCVDGLDCWVLRTCYELGRAGWPVSVSAELRPSTINIVGVRQFGRKARDVRSFVVAPRLDAHAPQLANYVVYQNNQRPDSIGGGTVYHWPQPNIRPRRPERAADIKRIVFKGHISNIDEEFRSQKFRDDLSGMGIEIEIDAISQDNRNQQWGDYENSDIVLAVRNLTHYDSQFKPASKLINAWFADVPALLGPEVAFQEVRRSELDYVEVTSGKSVIDALNLLRREPQRYMAMIENGRIRRPNFSVQSIVQMWVDLLNGDISDNYEEWEGKSVISKFVNFVSGFIKEPSSKSAHHAKILHGPRILDLHRVSES